MLQAIEAAETNSTLITLARLAEGFGVQVSELLAAAATTKRRSSANA